MNIICSQCGSVLAAGERACRFCESTESLSVRNDDAFTLTDDSATNVLTHEHWRGELDERLKAYRARRRKGPASEVQTALPFEEKPFDHGHPIAVEVDSTTSLAPSSTDDFAFTIAIGRVAKAPEPDPRLLIDVSVSPQVEPTELPSEPEALPSPQNSPFSLASLDERKRALLVDTGCLTFAYGAFLVLFGSLGGHFALNKLSAAVLFFTFAFVYLQYFGLFTVFGGSTPGMMVTGLHVASFTGDTPTPRQYMLRAIGYMLSAGTCFLGFLWVLWDEEGLAWHDRLSKTYLSRSDLLAKEDLSDPIAAR